MTDKVKPIFGGPTPGQADDDMIYRLEQLLELCRAGEITSLVYSARTRRKTHAGWLGQQGTRDEILADMARLQYMYVAAEGDEESRDL